MSRPRSRSPHYRRFPWEEPDFDPRKVIAELDGNPRDRGHHFREGPEDFRDSYREEHYPEGPRRSPFRDDPRFRHQRHPDHDEFFHHVAMRFENRRFSPRDEDFEGDRHRGEFRDDFKRFDDRGGRPPPLLPGLSPNLRSYADHQQRKAGMGWRREEQGRFRDFSPGMRSGDQRAEVMEKGGRFPQHANRGRHQHYDRGPRFKRQRWEMDVIDHPGFRDEEDFGNRGYSVDRPRGGFRGRNRGSFPRGDSGPFIGDHGVEGGRNQFDYDPNFDRPRSSSQECFREDPRGGHFQENPRDSSYKKSRRSPDARGYGNPANYRGRGTGRYDQAPRGKTGPHRNQPRHQGYPPSRDGYRDPAEKEPSWEDEEDRLQQWRHSRSRSQESNQQPKRSPQAKRGWNEPPNDNMAVVTEETLTIKVDMSRPVNNNSPLCYSSDRQLSLDLVNVGRQRLDFLPLLEHSGTYRESAAHTGTFAQEIITLVHFVKEQYFRGDGVTLNQRFSAPQKGGYSEEELEELTLNQRFSSNRGFSLNMDSLLDDEDDEPLFFKLGSMQEAGKQPLRGPGDLRHDLERRRQEKLEAVKVTIAGSGLSQRSQGESDGFWPGEQNRRREGSMGSRRGAYNRPTMGPQRRNNHFGNQRQNLHSNPPGPNW
ncbi:uncharacterized protein FYW61_016270 isoform 1-T1 [Anableps anableps]